MLDAVNQVLEIIGESPVNTLEDTTNVDVLTALRMLSRIKRTELTKGRVFNTLRNYTLNPDATTKRIPWSNLYLYLKGTDGTLYIKQGDYVFNFTDQTNKFESPISVEIFMDMDYDNLPEPFKAYIIAHAQHEFQKSMGSAELAEAVGYNIQQAQKALFEYELSINQPNLLSDGAVAEKRGR
jgi:hypothetical protein